GSISTRMPMSDPGNAVPRATDPNNFGLVAPYRSRSTWNLSRRASMSSRRASVSGVMMVSDMPSGYRPQHDFDIGELHVKPELNHVPVRNNVANHTLGKHGRPQRRNHASITPLVSCVHDVPTTSPAVIHRAATCSSETSFTTRSANGTDTVSCRVSLPEADL